MKFVFAILLTVGVTVLGCDAPVDQADREYRAAIRADNNGADLATVRGHLDRAVLLAPDRKHYRYLRAIAHIDSRMFTRALQDLDSVLVDNDHAYTLYLRGLVLCQLGRFEESLPSFEAAIHRQPDNAQFYRGRSLARTEVGLYAKALGDANELIRRSPHGAVGYYARGRALAALGRTSEAVQSLRRAVRLRGDLRYMKEALADAYERDGQFERARALRASLSAINGSATAESADPYRY